MKILIASALFPPDVAEPSSYLKELARRLSDNNSINVLAYGNIPEKVNSVKIITVPKNLPAPIRLLKFTLALLRLGKQADKILIENAPSTELPALFVGFFYRKKILFHVSDHKIVYRGWRKLIHKFVVSHSSKIIETKLPPQKPEILPFKSFPQKEMDDFESKWQKHLEEIKQKLS